MKYYYLISIDSRKVECENEILNDIFVRTCPELSKRFIQFIELVTADEKEDKRRALYNARKFNAETKQMYEDSQIPEELIVEALDSDMMKFREIVTGKILTTDNEYFGIHLRPCNRETAENIFRSSNYYKKVTNFFKKAYQRRFIKAHCDKYPFDEKMEGEMCIEGTLDGIPIQGNFTGKLRLTKKNHIQ